MKSDLVRSFEFQLKCVEVGGYVKEHQFAKEIGRLWRFDFAWVDEKLAVEIEGGVWVKGRHTRGSGFIRDCDKYNTATLMGWRVLRFAVNHIDNGDALSFTLKGLGLG